MLLPLTSPKYPDPTTYYETGRTSARCGKEFLSNGSSFVRTYGVHPPPTKPGEFLLEEIKGNPTKFCIYVDLRNEAGEDETAKFVSWGGGNTYTTLWFDFSSKGKTFTDSFKGTERGYCSIEDNSDEGDIYIFCRFCNENSAAFNNIKEKSEGAKTRPIYMRVGSDNLGLADTRGNGQLIRRKFTKDLPPPKGTFSVSSETLIVSILSEDGEWELSKLSLPMVGSGQTICVYQNKGNNAEDYGSVKTGTYFVKEFTPNKDFEYTQITIPSDVFPRPLQTGDTFYFYFSNISVSTSGTKTTCGKAQPDGGRFYRRLAPKLNDGCFVVTQDSEKLDIYISLKSEEGIFERPRFPEQFNKRLFLHIVVFEAGGLVLDIGSSDGKTDDEQGGYCVEGNGTIDPFVCRFKQNQTSQFGPGGNFDLKTLLNEGNVYQLWFDYSPVFYKGENQKQLACPNSWEEATKETFEAYECVSKFKANLDELKRLQNSAKFEQISGKIMELCGLGTGFSSSNLESLPLNYSTVCRNWIDYVLYLNGERGYTDQTLEFALNDFCTQHLGSNDVFYLFLSDIVFDKFARPDSFFQFAVFSYIGGPIPDPIPFPAYFNKKYEGGQTGGRLFWIVQSDSLKPELKYVGICKDTTLGTDLITRIQKEKAFNKLVFRVSYVGKSGENFFNISIPGPFESVASNDVYELFSVEKENTDFLEKTLVFGRENVYVTFFPPTKALNFDEANLLVRVYAVNTDTETIVNLPDDYKKVWLDICACNQKKEFYLDYLNSLFSGSNIVGDREIRHEGSWYAPKHIPCLFPGCPQTRYSSSLVTQGSNPTDRNSCPEIQCVQLVHVDNKGTIIGDISVENACTQNKNNNNNDDNNNEKRTQKIVMYSLIAGGGLILLVVVFMVVIMLIVVLRS